MTELIELKIRPPLVGRVTAEVISDTEMEVAFDGDGRKVVLTVHPLTDIAGVIAAAQADALRRWDNRNGGAWRPTQRDVVNRTKVRVLRPGYEGWVGTIFWCHPSGDRMRVFTDTNPSLMLLADEVAPVEPKDGCFADGLNGEDWPNRDDAEHGQYADMEEAF